MENKPKLVHPTKRKAVFDQDLHADVPRDKRDLHMEIDELLLGLLHVWDDTFSRLGDSEPSAFINDVFQPMLVDPKLDADMMLDEWLGSESESEREKQIERLVRTVAALCITARRLLWEEHETEGQSYAMTAAKWFGSVRAYWALTGEPGALEPGDRSSREVAKLAALARHAPNRERKVRLLAWYVENREKYRSMDAAAEVASRNFSVAFRTARDYIGEFRKQERSARKA